MNVKHIDDKDLCNYSSINYNTGFLLINNKTNEKHSIIDILFFDEDKKYLKDVFNYLLSLGYENLAYDIKIKDVIRINTITGTISSISSNQVSYYIRFRLVIYYEDFKKYINQFILYNV